MLEKDPRANHVLENAEVPTLDFLRNFDFSKLTPNQLESIRLICTGFSLNNLTSIGSNADFGVTPQK